MQLSETITIYLAIGAPFGVNYFLRERSAKNRRRSRSLIKAAGAGLLWPLIAAAGFLARRSSIHETPKAVEAKAAIDERQREQIAAAQRQLFAALERLRALAQSNRGASEDLEQSIRTAREDIEKYVGLTLVLAETNLDDAPANHELELCRVAGRAGEDLLLAGRCIHRRNVERLIAHQARSRTQLLHALAALREINAEPLATQPPEVAAARHMSVATLKVYGEAINLLSLLEDESAARHTARLLDAECARLRKLEALGLNFEKAVRTDGKHVRHTHADWTTFARR